MYIYTMQTMPGNKAKFDGDTSVKYRIKRTDNSASAGHNSRSDVIRTDLAYGEAAAMVKKFNDKEQEARILRQKEKAARASLSGGLLSL